MSKELFSLGEIYPSDFLAEGQEPTTEKVELKLIMDDDGLVRLEKTAPLNKMYGKYWYRSGVNQTMRDALKDVVDSVLKTQPMKPDKIWCDLAANDGTLLSFVPNYYTRVGVDPADDTYRIEALTKCDRIIQDYFSKEVWRNSMGDNKAFVVTSIAMFYDVPDPNKFIKDVYDILEDDGLWVMQLSYSPLMIRQMAFDNVCHEHLWYFSLSNLNNLLGEGGFYISDCELNDVNGGSIRLYIQKTTFAKYSDIGSVRVNSLLEWEKAEGFNREELWEEFGEAIEELKSNTVNFINVAKSSGKTIWAYGASTKGNTLLQYFGLDNTLITAIAERNPTKYGLRTIGSNIPIKSEEEMREAQPDYLLVLPWHFRNEFVTREKEYLLKGGKMIFPCPSFEVISNDTK